MEFKPPIYNYDYALQLSSYNYDYALQLSYNYNYALQLTSFSLQLQLVTPTKSLPLYNYNYALQLTSFSLPLQLITPTYIPPLYNYNYTLQLTSFTLQLQLGTPTLRPMTITSLQKGFLSECTERPWGFYASTFAMKGFKTKVFVVKPKHRLSLQSHEHRHELWTIVSGNGLCTVDDKVVEVTNDSFVMVPKGARHRIENVSDTDDLVIAEVQVGNYISESDIVRYDDDYGRGR